MVSYRSAKQQDALARSQNSRLPSWNFQLRWSRVSLRNLRWGMNESNSRWLHHLCINGSESCTRALLPCVSSNQSYKHYSLTSTCEHVYKVFVCVKFCGMHRYQLVVLTMANRASKPHFLSKSQVLFFSRLVVLEHGELKRDVTPSSSFKGK